MSTATTALSETTTSIEATSETITAAVGVLGLIGEALDGNPIPHEATPAAAALAGSLADLHEQILALAAMIQVLVPRLVPASAPGQPLN